VGAVGCGARSISSAALACIIHEGAAIAVLG
jgi:hypothetical protein